MKKVVLLLVMEILIFLSLIFYINKSNDDIKHTTAEVLVAVEIQGAIKQPGFYWLPKDISVAELIYFAGGLLPNADIKQINLHEKIAEKMYDIPYFKTSSQSDYIVKINLNQATIDQLRTIPSMSSQRLENFIAYRVKVKTIYQIEELLNVAGIGEATFEKMKLYVTV